ncbi:MAG: GntR family transcriptional regulator [Candidatus Limnocylindrales bacterium]
MTVALRLDPGDPTPPYEQLRRQLATAIESGVLQPGTRLPTVRQLSADLGVATGTVMRSYAELEGDGLIVTRRGGGTTVGDSPRTLSEAERGRRLAEITSSFVSQARLVAVSDNDIRRAVERLLG